MTFNKHFTQLFEEKVVSSLVALVLDSQSQQSADYLNKLRFRNENMANFVDVSGVLNSPAWQYFLRSKETNQAKCTVSRCNAILKTSGGNTTTLLDHLKNIHKIIPEQSQPSSKRQKTSQYTSPFWHCHQVVLLVNAHFQQPDYFQQRFEADLVILL